MERLGLTTKPVVDTSPFSQLGMTNTRLSAAVNEAKMLGQNNCLCSLALSSRPIALHARIGDTGDTVAAYVPGVAPTTYTPSDLCETPCSSTLADRLVVNLAELVLAICRTISRIMNTNAPSEEVRVHFTDVGRPAQQFLTCTATWTYASEDELEELAEGTLRTICIGLSCMSSGTAVAKVDRYADKMAQVQAAARLSVM